MSEYLGQPGCPFDVEDLLPAQRTLARMVQDFYALEGKEMGGEWHVQLDDFNVDFDMDDTLSSSEFSSELARRWNSMTVAERMGTLRLAHRY